ncbi:MAG: hypothetical protein C5S52_01500 [ANME-2 cluster archaeon]|nr:hypothetical protein [ANME-2 cluster archaeon]
MRVKVDMESDALYFRLCGDDIEDSEEIAQGIIIDYTKEDTVVGIEILGIKARLPAEELSRMTIELPYDHTASPSIRALMCSCVIAPLATHRI